MMKDNYFRVLSVFAALPLLACGSGDEGKLGSIQMPLVAESTGGDTYRLSPASFRVTGGAGVNRVVDGAGVDVLNVDLAPGSYLINLLAGWQLNLVEGGMSTPVMAVLQSPNPQGFEIQEGVITDIVYRFGVGPDAIAFGQGRGRVTIEVNDGCPEQDFFADADGDGFGSGAAVTACEAPAGHVATGGDCDDANAAVNPSATEICNAADDNCDGVADDGNVCQKRVFLTSQVTTLLGGIAGGDAFCQARANAAGLGGTFIAWLSTNMTGARFRLDPNAGPFVDLDGVTVADNIADLTDGTLDWFIGTTETGGPDTGALVFTGTLADGNPGQTCGNWMQPAGQANAGSAGSVGPAWTNSQLVPCGFAQALYCFEQ